MSVPVIVLAAVALAGALAHSAATTGMSIVMWVGMPGAMLVRWSEHVGHCHSTAGPESIAA